LTCENDLLETGYYQLQESPRSKSCSSTSVHRGRPTAQSSMAKSSASTVGACFFAFDLLFVNGHDMRLAQLADRKHELRKLLARLPATSRVRYAEHIEALGKRLFEQVCALDLEGIVAKQRFAPYTFDRQISTWYKIRNQRYSQMVGREKLF